MLFGGGQHATACPPTATTAAATALHNSSAKQLNHTLALARKGLLLLSFLPLFLLHILVSLIGTLLDSKISIYVRKITVSTLHSVIIK
jgi:hypothetical protein